MLQTLKNRRAEARDNDKGFTLIELMVVVLIIAILLAIAIPTFLGAQNKAKNRSAQSSVRNGLTAAETIFADTAEYAADATVLVTELNSAETNITFQAGASDGPKVVNVVRYSDTGVAFVAKSKTGTCYGVYTEKAGTGAGTFYGQPAAVAGNCSAPATAPTWDADSETGW